MSTLPVEGRALQSRGQVAAWIVSLLASALLLCAVAIVNGGPIYYPDTAAYLIDADKLAHMRPPFAVRPVFYGLAVWPFHWGTFFYSALYVQALVVTHVIYLTARSCDARLRPLGFFGLIAGLVVFTPVSFHASHLLPDIFMGVLILSLFLLGFSLERLGKYEAAYLLLLATAAISFHLTALPVGLAIFALSLVLFFRMSRSGARPLLILAPIALAVILSLSFSFAVFQQLTLTPKNPPHLLARILADGPGRDFLRVTCPDSGFILCNYQDRLTSVEDDFLWRLLPDIPVADGYRIKAEAQAVISGTVRMYPLEVAKHMLLNTLRQLITFQSETQVSSQEWVEFQETNTPLAQSIVNSLQAKRLLEKPSLDWMNSMHAGVVLASLVVVALQTARALRGRRFRPVLLTTVVVTGLVANAFACGALGGVFGRYEGRVIWLVPLMALIGVFSSWRSTRKLHSSGSVPASLRLQPR